ncbi:zinc ribbon domain-containing protein [Wolbachia endosymbiont of Encarsia formosa]|uniref:zinc ribbon domain-containing protein n=1 Tax=Wolbachia endosymbiont of Encarsia formosa TaxID=77125 RepID=UPI0031BA5F43
MKFDIVQEQLSENRKRARMQRSGRRYLLQGLIVCQCCKYIYYGMSNVKGGRSYYRCPGNRFGGNRVCNSKSIQVDILEEAVWEEVKMVLKEPEAMTKEYQLRLVKHESTEAKDEIEKRANKIEQGIERLAYVYARGHITKEKYDLEVESMAKELKGIRDQREEMVDEKRLQRELDFITSSVESFSSEVELELNQADWETKLDIIRKLVQRIEVDDDNVHVVFRLKELALERQKKSVQHCIGSPVSSTEMTPSATYKPNVRTVVCQTLTVCCASYPMFIH